MLRLCSTERGFNVNFASSCGFLTGNRLRITDYRFQGTAAARAGRVCSAHHLVASEENVKCAGATPVPSRSPENRSMNPSRRNSRVCSFAVYRRCLESAGVESSWSAMRAAANRPPEDSSAQIRAIDSTRFPIAQSPPAWASNGLRYSRWGGRGFCSGTEITRIHKNNA